MKNDEGCWIRTYQYLFHSHDGFKFEAIRRYDGNAITCELCQEEIPESLKFQQSLCPGLLRAMPTINPDSRDLGDFETFHYCKSTKLLDIRKSDIDFEKLKLVLQRYGFEVEKIEFNER